MSLTAIKEKVPSPYIGAIIRLTQLMYSFHNVAKPDLAELDGKAGKAIKTLSEEEIASVFGAELTAPQKASLKKLFDTAQDFQELLDVIVPLLPANDIVEEVA